MAGLDCISEPNHQFGNELVLFAFLWSAVVRIPVLLVVQADVGREELVANMESGTGLGLAIVKNIALQYNGTATTTTPSGGLTIEIELMM